MSNDNLKKALDASINGNCNESKKYMELFFYDLGASDVFAKELISKVEDILCDCNKDDED